MTTKHGMRESYSNLPQTGALLVSNMLPLEGDPTVLLVVTRLILGDIRLSFSLRPATSLLGEGV